MGSLLLLLPILGLIAIFGVAVRQGGSGDSVEHPVLQDLI